MVNVSRLNEPYRTIKMGAMKGVARGEHFVISARCLARFALLSALTAGCVKDDVKPPPDTAAAVAAPVPIVDMSEGAREPLLPAATPVVAPDPAARRVTAAPVPARGAVVVSRGDVSVLRSRALTVPVSGVPASSLRGSFDDARGGRLHEAMDIAAPRGTPVLSADDGTVLKLFTSRGGGLTVYVADPTKSFIYYYAHLDAYAPGLAEGQSVAKGQTVGTVGTTGNAPPNTPHLHFAILRNSDMKRWWTGTPIDPFLVLRPSAAP